ncbi:MAG: hypothetical protein NTU61_03550 [Candidatus Altiarchaeota archaeon]|nr:hypothetical protein [Candidatus Altiarchaeota archaeon]
MEKSIFLNCLVLAVLLSAFVSAASAQENVSGDEVKAFAFPLGAEVRLLQLESAIERDILVGREVVAAIKEYNSSIDTSELESIIFEMEVLKGEVESINPGAGNDSAQQFVDLKSDAIELSKEFRDIVHALVKPSELEGLRGRIRSMNQEQFQKFKANVTSLKLEFNAQQLERLLSKLNVTDPELVDQVRNGNASVKDVIDSLRGSLGNMSNGKRNALLMKIHEENSKSNVFARSVVDKVRLNYLQRTNNRLQKRLERVEAMNITNNVTNRIQNRLELVGLRMGQIENRTQGMSGKMGNFTGKGMGKLQGKLGKNSGGDDQ